MSRVDIERHARELWQALKSRSVVEPLTQRLPGLGVDDAYRISSALLALRQADGERLVGKKIGVTSDPVQRMLDVDQPDFGYLTDAMEIPTGGTVPVTASMIQPRAEAEIAFVLRRELRGPGVTAADVIQATDFVAPCLEIVDSRIRDWNIRIADTVADNASCGYFVLGHQCLDPRDVDLATCGVVMECNGTVVSTGAGAAALGSSPIACVVWLANRLGTSARHSRRARSSCPARSSRFSRSAPATGYAPRSAASGTCRCVSNRLRTRWRPCPTIRPPSWPNASTGRRSRVAPLRRSRPTIRR